jgi:twinkle protein
MLEQIEATTNHLAYGQHKVVCPLCSDQRRKHKRDKPLSVNVSHEAVVYNCHHCGENGVINKERKFKMEIVKGNTNKNTNTTKNTKTNGNKAPNKLPENDMTGASAKWLEERGICLQTAIEYGTSLHTRKYKPVIGFSFVSSDGELEAVKYRSANGSKVFWWEGNSDKFWGYNKPDPKLKTIEDTVVITEGEIDALAIKTAFKDYANIDVYSVPNGAPSKIKEGKVDPSEDTKFKYVWEDREKFENVNRIILATDNDKAGDVLAQELARRMNIAKCYRMDYRGFKDSNEVLLAEGSEALRKMVLGSEEIPLHGLHSLNHYQDQIQDLYDGGKPKGVSTGFKSVDSLFTLSTGQLYIVSGYAGDGKSAFIDSLVVNMANTYGWKTCYCSFEKSPSLHSVQLMQLKTGKPFFRGANQRMSQEEKDFAETWINDHILFQDYMGDELPTIEAVLEKSASAVCRYGTRCLVIDPYNFIHRDRSNGLETDYISDLLTKTQLHAKKHDIMVFFVAHPSKPMLRDGKKRVVNGIDISGSFAWSSKADVGITVHRNESDVEIHTWKCRFSWNGSLGNVRLGFNPINGRYFEQEKIEDNFDWDI